jgi:signal transduction histidine kinase
LLDAGLAALIFFPLSVGGLFEAHSGRSTQWVAATLLLAAAQAAPLYWRRQHPVIVLAMVASAVTAILLLGYQTPASVLAVVVAVYSVSVYAPSRPRLLVAGLVALAVVIGVGGGLVSGRRDILPVLTPIAALSLAGWVAGDYLRSRRRFVAELEGRAQALARELEDARRLAAEEERLRIARELHDVVAHNVSVIAIQAGAARMAGGNDRSGHTLHSIEGTARDTLAELNRLLGVLRKDRDGAARAPQPGLEQVEGLLKPARLAGLKVELRVTGERRPLPAALDVTAYRIVQEAVTNVLRHAAASRLDVAVNYGPGTVTLTIADDGQGSSQETIATSTGHGLIGMQERVALFNGELQVASTPVGGFTVTARLPVSP